MPLIRSGAEQVPGGDVAGTVEEPGSSKVGCVQMLSCALLSMLLTSASCLSCKRQACVAQQVPHVSPIADWADLSVPEKCWVLWVVTQLSAC